MSERIDNLDDIMMAIQRKKSLYCPMLSGWNKPKPAAFVINLSGSIINRLISSGLFVYEKPDDKRFYNWFNSEAIFQFGVNKFNYSKIKYACGIAWSNGRFVQAEDSLKEIKK